MRCPIRRAFSAVQLDGASVAAFRMALGLLLVWEVTRYFSNSWIERYWVQPSFHFRYYAFSWVPLVPQPWLSVEVFALGVAGVMVAVGFRHRVATFIAATIFLHLFLLEQARYLNHFYAAFLFLCLVGVTPAGQTWGLDALRSPASSRGRIPMWSLTLLRFQVAIIYVFAAVAKLDPDWLSGRAITPVIATRMDRPFIRWLFEMNVGHLVFSGGGFLLDALLIPALLWKRTRIVAFTAAVVFHVLNAQVFQIGIFPWMMIAATALFLSPQWPRRMLSGLMEVKGNGAPPRSPRSPPSRGLLIAMVTYGVVQLVVPLRHYLYPGDVTWTEEGHRFSWRMMLRSKSGQARFLVVTQGDTAIVDASERLPRWQWVAMIGDPDMLLQFAHHLAEEEENAGRPRPRVYGDVSVSLNGRGRRPMIDPAVDLAAVSRSILPASWIEPGPRGVPPGDGNP
jgi:vitamin K-dependent gamma-carboxylase